MFLSSYIDNGYRVYYIQSLLFICLVLILFIFFFKQKTAYEMRISDWSSDVCSSDLIEHSRHHRPRLRRHRRRAARRFAERQRFLQRNGAAERRVYGTRYPPCRWRPLRSERHDRPARRQQARHADRQGVVSGTSVSVRVEFGGRRISKKHRRDTVEYRKRYKEINND